MMAGMGRQITESQAMWAIIAVIIGVDALWAWSIGIWIAVSPIAVSCVVFASGIGFVYANLRPNRRIAVLAFTSAQLIAFSAAGACLVYLTVASKFPLVDRYLAAGDVAIGLDWLALFNFVQEHPAIDFVFDLSYASAIPQTGVLLVILSTIGRLDRLREFRWLFVLTLLITIPLSSIFPAESAWVYFGVTDHIDAYHLADFTALRAGQMPEIPMGPANGLITFPSFHAAMALILIYAARGIPVLFPVSLGLNVLMIASTPSEGGHYFVDLIAGLAVVPLAIFILRSLSERLRLKRSSPSP